MNARIAVLLTLVATSVALAQEKADLPRDIFGGLITARNDMDKWHTGKVKALTDSTVTVEGMNFKPDALKGKVINPNFDRPITSEGLYSGFYYRIVGNTADTITVDTSGGKLTDHAQAGDTYLMAGFFHIEKAGNRYVMIDPLGHPFIPMGPCAFGVDLSRYMTADLLKLKYGTSQKWLEASVARLKGLGWTATMEFGGITWAGRYGQNRHPCLPYIRIVRVAEEGMRQKTSEPRGVWDSPIKNLLEGIHIRIFMDVFDPQFAKSYGKGEYRPWGNSPTEANDPWVIGYVTEEGDNLYGILRPKFSLGWCAMAAMPLQTSAKVFGGEVKYTDTKVYTKHALAGFLKDKYGTIQKLNASWGSDYTGFGSDGGWGKGKGVLDENGKLGQKWMGKPIQEYDPHDWEGANPNCKRDLLEFQVKIVEQFYKGEYQGLKEFAPEHLVMGYTNDTTLSEEYWAEAKWVDMTFSPLPEVIWKAKATGGNVVKPCFITGYLGAEEDSPYAPEYKDGKKWRWPGTFFKTQPERGQEYYDRYLKAFERTTAGGVKPTLGMIWWAWGDADSEVRNWGVCTNRDNLYDGKEATKAGADGKLGTWDDEAADYGDCVTRIRQANAEVTRRLLAELAGKKLQPAATGGATKPYSDVPDNPAWRK